MVLVEKHVTLLLLVVEWLKSNHLTAFLSNFAPLPTSTMFSFPMGGKSPPGAAGGL